MLDQPPDKTLLQQLMTPEVFAIWDSVIAKIERHYEMAAEWHPVRKENKFELKYRWGGKTLCALYPREKSFGFMVIFGKAEREKFEARRSEFSAATSDLHNLTYRLIATG